MIILRITFFIACLLNLTIHCKVLLIQSTHAKNIQSLLEKTCPDWDIFNYQSKDSTDQITAASAINRLNPDLFIIINYAVRPSLKTSFCIYFFALKPTDHWPKKSEPCSFIPFTQAHLVSAEKSYSYSETLCAYLTEHSFKATCFHCPFKQLGGIACPALTLEIIVPLESDIITLDPTVISSLQTLLSYA